MDSFLFTCFFCTMLVGLDKYIFQNVGITGVVLNHTWRLSLPHQSNNNNKYDHHPYYNLQQYFVSYIISTAPPIVVPISGHS